MDQHHKLIPAELTGIFDSIQVRIRSVNNDIIDSIDDGTSDNC